MGGKVGRGLLFVSSLLYLQPEAVVLFLLWTEIFPFIFSYYTLCVNKSEAFCVCVHMMVCVAVVNIYELVFLLISLLFQVLMWVFVKDEG